MGITIPNERTEGVFERGWRWEGDGDVPSRQQK